MNYPDLTHEREYNTWVTRRRTPFLADPVQFLVGCYHFT
jgi:hypothetical protein